MEWLEDQELNLNIKRNSDTDVGAPDNISLVGFFVNCLKQITSVIPKFIFHANYNNNYLSNASKPVEKFKEIGIQTKLNKNGSLMEVTKTTLVSPNVKIYDINMEHKAALIPNTEPDVVDLINPRHIKSSDSCLVRLNSSDSSAQELELFGPMSECHSTHMKTATISIDRITDDKKLYINFADVNRHKLTTLIQTMMTDVLNLTQNIDDVLIDGVSFTLSVDLRKDKQRTMDSAQSNSEMGSITKRMGFKFKEMLPTMECNDSELKTIDTEILPTIASKFKLNTITTPRTQKSPQDKILNGDQLLAVEEKEEMSSSVYDLCSDALIIYKNGTSDLVSSDKLNKQELKFITSSIVELPLDEMHHSDQLLAVEEEGNMTCMVDGVHSDDTLTLENRISVIDLICCDIINKPEFNETDTIDIENISQDEILRGEQLLVAEEKKETFSLTDILSDDTLTLKNTISTDDLPSNDTKDKQDIKRIDTTSEEKLRDNDILNNNKLKELPTMTNEVNSNDVSTVENRIPIPVLASNHDLPAGHDNEKLTNTLKDGNRLNNELIEIKSNKMINELNNELIDIATNELNNELIKIATTQLIEMTTTQLSNELIEIVITALNNELIKIATIERNTKLLEIKNKTDVKRCSAIKLSEKISLTNDINKSSLPEHSTLKIKLSVSKYCSVTEGFLNILSYLDDTPDDGPMKSTIMVPACYFRIWYFQNLRQGFLLNIMLRKANVNTLNFMRNLYFVIITTESQSLSIAINFVIQNEILGHCKEPSIHFFKGDCKYRVSSKDVEQIFTPETGIVESCTTYEECNSNNTNIQSRSDLSSLYSTLLAGKVSAATSYLYFDLFNKQHRVDVAVGESKFELQSDIGLHDMYAYRYKTWFTGMLSAPKREINTFFNYDVNETVFEQFSIDRFMESVSGKVYPGIYSSGRNSNVYSLFLKCFGHTIACTMISFFLSMF